MVVRGAQKDQASDCPQILSPQPCHLLRLRLLLKGLLLLLLPLPLTGLLLTGLLLADLAGDTDLAFSGLALMVSPAASCSAQLPDVLSVI